MKTFTIDAENNITVHASRKVAKDTGLPSFATEVQFADLIGGDNKRLVEIFNSLPGVKPVTKFANRKFATERIWKVIQGLGESVAEAPKAEEPQPNQQPVATAEPVIADAPPAEAQPAPREPQADVSAQLADIARVEAVPVKDAIPAKKAPKAKKAAKAESAGPREGSKTAQVVAMLQRENGATISEIMTTMGWQKHTVRGFMAGAMKKAGHAVESFKPDGGERTYRINK